MSTDAIILLFTIGCYTAAGALFIWSAGGPSAKTKSATILATIGLAAHTGLIVATGIRAGHPPFTNLRESLTFVGWAVMAIFLTTRRARKPAVLGAAASLICVIAVGFGSVLPKSTNDYLLPALKNKWSIVHVATSLAGYAGFVFAFCSALLHTVQESLLRNKRTNRLQQGLPSLDALDRFSYKMVAIGFPLFTVGIVTGSLWAQSAWGSYWSWDPKETWSLVTWLVYAAYLHVRALHGRRGRLANRLLVIGFICTLITFFGVNFFAGGLHSYNW